MLVLRMTSARAYKSFRNLMGQIMRHTKQDICVNMYGQASNGETVEYRIEREAQAEDVDVCAVEPVAHFVSRWAAVR